MPELPQEISARLGKLGLTPRDIEVLMTVDSGREVGYDGVVGQGAVGYFDAISQGRDPKVVVNWYVVPSLSLCSVILTSPTGSHTSS